MQKKKAAAMLLAALMVFSGTISAHAVQFTDIDDHWGRSHIENMAEKGVVSGSDHPVTGERVYNPDDPVTKVEATVMLYSVLQHTDQLTSDTDYTSKYRTMLETARIPDWATRQVGYGLETGIVTTGDLSGFMRAGDPDPEQEPATREQVAIFFGRALDEAGEAEDADIDLGFDDTEQIGTEALPYVNLLVEQDILSGDDQNRFNPQDTITRAEMAAMVSKTFELFTGDADPETDDNDEIVIDLSDSDDADTRSIQRTIEQINTDRRTVFVVDDEDELEMYRIEEDADIKIRGSAARIYDLRNGQTVEMEVDDEGNAFAIEVDPEPSEVEMVIRRITDLEDYHVLSVEPIDNRDDRQNLRVHDTTEIRLGGKEATVDDLSTGDEVFLDHDGLNVIRISDATGDFSQEEGILDSLSLTRYPYQLTIRTFGNRLEEFELDEDVRVYIDGSRSDLDELITGDIIELDIEDGRVIRVDAVGKDRTQELEGTLQNILRTLPRDQLTLLTEDGEEETYPVSRDVRVYVEDERSSLGELPLNSPVEIILEGGLVTEIDAQRVRGTNVVQGEIVRFYDRSNRMVLDYLNPDTDSYEHLSVYVDDETTFIDIDGSSTDFGRLNRDDFIFVSGVYEGDALIADRVIVLEE